jgi:hypothetical protein
VVDILSHRIRPAQIAGGFAAAGVLQFDLRISTQFTAAWWQTAVKICVMLTVYASADVVPAQHSDCLRNTATCVHLSFVNALYLERRWLCAWHMYSTHHMQTATCHIYACMSNRPQPTMLPCCCCC